MNNVTAKSMFESTIKSVLSKHGKLFEFLSLVSRLYQFKTTNLILIYAQRPDAEMLKKMEEWNAHKRVLNENAQGIAVFVKKELHYVFDLNDTTGELITLEECIQPISDLSMHMDDVYRTEIHSYEKLLLNELEGTLLEEIDEELLPGIFEMTVKSVATIIIENTFQIESSSVLPSDLKWVPSFNSTKIGYLLLSASIFVAREVIKLSKEVQAIEENDVDTKITDVSSDVLQLAEEKLKGNVQENTPEERVVNYLLSVLKEPLAKRILLEEKNFQKCWQYICSVARKQAINGAAMLDDQTVYDLAVTYFETDLESDKEKEIKTSDSATSTTQEFIEKMKQERLEKEKKQTNQLSFLGGDFDEKK
ncbi:MAG: hypothetical protein JXQ26_05410 [Tissierellales bacterium]|nr:hypothetical protein [Tissierellales bacterium]